MTAPASLAEALAALQAQLPHVGKARDSNRGKYADLTDLTDALMPVMAPLGLSFSAKPTLSGAGFVLEYVLRHTSGEHDGGEYPLPDPDKIGPQGLGSAITYARRYSLCAVTGIAPGGDDDKGRRADEERQRPVSEADQSAPGSMARWQHREIEMLLGRLGLRERDDRHKAVCDVLRLDEMPVNGKGNPTMLALSYAQAEETLRGLREMHEDERAEGEP